MRSDTENRLLVGGPDRFMLLKSPDVSVVITLDSSTGRSCGVAALREALTTPQMTLVMGKTKLDLGETLNPIAEVDASCTRQAATRKINDGLDDVAWNARRHGILAFSSIDNDSYLGIVMECTSNRLVLELNGVPKNAKQGERASITVELDGGRLRLPARARFHEAGMERE